MTPPRDSLSSRPVRLREIAKQLAHTAPLPATLVDFARFKVSHSSRLSSHLSGDASIIARIRNKGYIAIENYASEDYCRRCIADIDQMVDSGAPYVHQASDLRVFGAETLSENIRQFAEDPYLANMSDHYSCVETANIFTLGARLVHHAGNAGSGEGWHKDMAFRQFKALLYLNDVDEDNGPFQLVEGSHKVTEYLKDMWHGGLGFHEIRFTDDQIERMTAGHPERIRSVTGKRGTLILVDTAVIHRGRPPITGMRYALTNYFMERYQVTEDMIQHYNPASHDKVRRLGQNWDSLRRPTSNPAKGIK